MHRGCTIAMDRAASQQTAADVKGCKDEDDVRLESDSRFIGDEAHACGLGKDRKLEGACGLCRFGYDRKRAVQIAIGVWDS
jgi:hypothetical protein